MSNRIRLVLPVAFLFIAAGALRAQGPADTSRYVIHSCVPNGEALSFDDHTV